MEYHHGIQYGRGEELFAGAKNWSGIPGNVKPIPSILQVLQRSLYLLLKGLRASIETKLKSYGAQGLGSASDQRFKLGQTLNLDTDRPPAAAGRERQAHRAIEGFGRRSDPLHAGLWWGKGASHM